SQLITARHDRSGQAPLTTESANATNDGIPSWSTNGKQVVFRRANGLKRNLYILDVASGTTRKLETGSDYDTFPTWSGRGDWIAFMSNRADEYETYRIRPDGTGLQRLTRSAGNDAPPPYSPDGAWIAFATAPQASMDDAVGLF